MKNTKIEIEVSYIVKTISELFINHPAIDLFVDVSNKQEMQNYVLAWLQNTLTEMDLTTQKLLTESLVKRFQLALHEEGDQ